MTHLIIASVVGWVACPFLGDMVGSRRNAGGAGFILGLLLGPLGVLLAFGLDNRGIVRKVRRPIKRRVDGLRGLRNVARVR